MGRMKHVAPAVSVVPLRPVRNPISARRTSRFLCAPRRSFCARELQFHGLQARIKWRNLFFSFFGVTAGSGWISAILENVVY